MFREHALQQLREHIEGSCVSRRRVQEILGEKKYKALLKDKIRNVGWRYDSVYYWNVLDYMCMPEPPDEEVKKPGLFVPLWNPSRSALIEKDSDGDIRILDDANYSIILNKSCAADLIKWLTEFMEQ